MIQKVDDSFPVPVSGKPIQQGWFGALVRFVNSLRLRGDGRYFMVSRNLGGTTIQPSTALLQALDRSGGAAPSAGGGVQPAVLGFPDYMSAVAITYPTVAKKTTQNVWITGDVLINHLGSGSGGSVYFGLSTEPNSGGIWGANIAYFFTSDIEYYTSFIIPVPAGIYYKFSINGSATLTAYEISCIS
jgi:hypothetical protein